MTTESSSFKTDIKQAIIRSLRLPLTVEDIGDSTPLFGEGLGLDSIDVLELVIEIERTFGAKIADERTGMEALQSVDTIAAFITRDREGRPA
jgi:acyl carrier protein